MGDDFEQFPEAWQSAVTLESSRNFSPQRISIPNYFRLLKIVNEIETNRFSGD
jgi:hypothetical protein